MLDHVHEESTSVRRTERRIRTAAASSSAIQSHFVTRMALSGQFSWPPNRPACAVERKLCQPSGPAATPHSMHNEIYPIHPLRWAAAPAANRLETPSRFMMAV